MLTTGVVAFAIVAVELPAVELPRPALPSVADVQPLAQTSVLVDRNGKKIADLHGEENRYVIPLSKMSEHLINAVIAVEDDSFYEHGGLDAEAIVRAGIANLAQGEVRQGGSTITQQYVRNAFSEVGRGRTFERKVREALLALEVEKQLEKNEILERYLNTVYFGRGAYGAQAAAREYFGKPASKLAVQEAAYLAGVIQAPGFYDAKPKAAIARRNYAIDRMVALGFVEEEAAAEAKETELKFRRGEEPVRAAYFVEYVRRLLKLPESEGGFGLTDEQILAGGLRVQTTLDLKMQRAAERAVKRVLPGKRDPEAAMVAMTTHGEIRAMVGGRTFDSIERARGFNFATQRGEAGGRQVGSAFKPFTLAAFLDRGYSPYSTFRAPSRIEVRQCPNGPGEYWRPGNYDNVNYGTMSAVEATAKSVNTVYAQMVARVGPRRAMKMAQAAGITSPMEPVCSISLGVFGVTPLEMARAYATFAARGRRPDVLAVTEITAPDGTVVASRKPQAERTIERKVADQVNKVLEQVMRGGTGTPAAIDRPAAGKTGTTEERRDVWFAGHTPHPGMAAAVWIGHPPNKKGKIRRLGYIQGRPATGGYFAGRIWKYFMEDALDGTKVRSFPGVSMSGRKIEAPRERRYTSSQRRSSGGSNRERRRGRDREDD